MPTKPTLISADDISALTGEGAIVLASMAAAKSGKILSLMLNPASTSKKAILSQVEFMLWEL